MDTPFIVVATPCFGGAVSALYTQSVLALQETCLARGIRLSFRLLAGDALITRARNALVQYFLALPDATHMLFVDADIGFSPDQAFALLRSNKDVCGAAYPLKAPNWDRQAALARNQDGHLPASGFNYVLDFLEPPPRSVPEFLPVRSIGTGFLMIRRPVLERMWDQYPELHYNNANVASNRQPAGREQCALFDCQIDSETGVYLSEDYAFCKRWRDMGGEIWVHTRSRLVHVGQTEYRGDLAAMLRSLHGAEPDDRPVSSGGTYR